MVNFVMSYRKLTRLPSPEPTLFDVHPFLLRMVQLAEHQHPCPNIRITLEAVPEDLMVFADESMLAQVMTNLLKNAIHAIGTSVEGEIRLRAYVDDQDMIHIEVSNNGPEITPEMAEQIFIPFFTTKEPEKGTGLGLAIVAQVVEDHSGNISVESKVNEGTTIAVSLSRVVEPTE